MQKIDGTTIKLNRGDILDLTLTLKLSDNTTYTFKSGDYIKFSVYEKKKMSDNALFMKKIYATAGQTSIELSLTNEETKIGELINKPTEYWYEFELNDEYTVIGYDENGPKILLLYPEGKKEL